MSLQTLVSEKHLCPYIKCMSAKCFILFWFGCQERTPGQLLNVPGTSLSFLVYTCVALSWNFQVTSEFVDLVTLNVIL